MAERGGQGCMVLHPIAVPADVHDVAVVDEPSISTLAITSSPKIFPHYSKLLFDVSTVLARS